MSAQKILKENLNELLTKEMDRKDFLKHIAIAAVAVSGVAGVISALSGKRLTGSAKSNTSYGYGSMTYGGK